MILNAEEELVVPLSSQIFIYLFIYLFIFRLEFSILLWKNCNISNITMTNYDDFTTNTLFAFDSKPLIHKIFISQSISKTFFC